RLRVSRAAVVSAEPAASARAAAPPAARYSTRALDGAARATPLRLATTALFVTTAMTMASEDRRHGVERWRRAGAGCTRTSRRERDAGTRAMQGNVHAACDRFRRGA